MAKKSIAKSPDAVNYEKLATLLREARESKKAEQKALSLAMGENRTWAQKNEYMLRRVDVIEFYNLAKALSIDPQELFKQLVQRLEGTDPD